MVMIELWHLLSKCQKIGMQIANMFAPTIQKNI